jgi:hypothetical protein
LDSMAMNHLFVSQSAYLINFHHCWPILMA